MALFLVIESRVPSPLVPLGLQVAQHRIRPTCGGVLWAESIVRLVLPLALYLQQVLGTTR